MARSGGLIAISFEKKPGLGKVAHEATLVCGHGTSTWIVFGKDEQLLKATMALGVNHRRQRSCHCQPATFDARG